MWGSQDSTTATVSFKMTTMYKFENNWVKSTAEVLADGSLKEVEGFRMRTSAVATLWSRPGMVFPSLDAWISAMTAEADKRAPWYAERHTYKLSFRPEDADKRSSVVWVPSKKHYMEVRRGSQTTFSERLYWLSLKEWLQHCMPKA